MVEGFVLRLAEGGAEGDGTAVRGGHDLVGVFFLSFLDARCDGSCERWGGCGDLRVFIVFLLLSLVGCD